MPSQIPFNGPSRRSILGAAGAMVAASVAPVALAQQRSGVQAAQPPAQSGGEELLMRTIPSSGEKIPSIGLGTSRQFDADPNDQAAMEELKAALQAFLDNGGTVVDSSPMYGRAEEVVGKLSTEMGINDRLWLATKVWTQRGQNGPEQMQESMKLMGREGGPIELMQVHNLVDIEEHLPRLKEMKESGTYKYIGITSSARNVIPELTEYAEGKKGDGVKLDFIQLPYNVELREAEERLLPACRENGVATMINVPFGSGRIFRELGDKPLPDHAKEWADSWAQAMLKFSLANEAVTVIIPGTSDPKHAIDNTNAMRGRLPTEEERRRLLEAVGA